MRKTLGICLLALLLTGPAVAGEMPNDKPAPPPPSAQEPTPDGDVQFPGVSESLTQAALELLAALL